MLTPKQAADLFGVTVKTFYRYLRFDPPVIFAVRHSGPRGHWRISRASVVHFRDTGRPWEEKENA